MALCCRIVSFPTDDELLVSLPMTDNLIYVIISLKKIYTLLKPISPLLKYSHNESYRSCTLVGGVINDKKPNAIWRIQVLC